jgi:hypothetical protein
MTTMTAQTTQVYSVFIRATPEQVWDAITKPEFTMRYFYGSELESTFEQGASYEEFRGLSILRVDVEEARRLKESDPAVQAGRFLVRVMPWTVPAGAMSFAPTRFPHSVAEAMSQSVAE